MYADELREEISQGDILDGVQIPFYVLEAGGTYKVQFKPALAMVLSHDCEIDKPHTHFILIAEVRNIDTLDEASRGNVIKRVALNTFFLEERANMVPSFVDLRRMDRVAKADMQRLVSGDRRIASINDEARDALQFCIGRYFGIGR